MCCNDNFPEMKVTDFSRPPMPGGSFIDVDIDNEFTINDGIRFYTFVIVTDIGSIGAAADAVAKAVADADIISE